MKSFYILSFSLLVLVGCPKSRQEKTNQGSATNRDMPLELYWEGSLVGYRDLSGQVAIKPRFAEAGDFSWGLARVKPDSKGGWGYIDASGNEVVHPQFEAAGDFADGITVVLSRGQFIYIGPDGSSLGLFEEYHPGKPLTTGDTLFVVHPNGLIVRTSGDVHAAPVCQVPPDGVVELVSDVHPSRSATPDGLLGSWRLVRYHRQSGYLFDLYISRYPQLREHQPVEHYRLVSSSSYNDEYSIYTLTKFATGGYLIEHTGLNWTEGREVIPDVNVDKVVARLKLHPVDNIGSLVSMFDGSSRTYTTSKGDSIVVKATRDSGGFLESVTLLKKNEESSLDVTIDKYGQDACEIVTISSTQPVASTSQSSNPF